MKPHAKPRVFTQEIHCTSFSTSKRHDSNADDADWADLRGFLSRLRRDGKIATKPLRHKATKKTFSIQRTLCLRALVAKKLCRRQSKIRVNPRHPRRPRCYCCRFGKNSVLVKFPDSVELIGCMILKQRSILGPLGQVYRWNKSVDAVPAGKKGLICRVFTPLATLP